MRHEFSSLGGGCPQQYPGHRLQFGIKKMVRIVENILAQLFFAAQIYIQEMGNVKFFGIYFSEILKKRGKGSKLYLSDRILAYLIVIYLVSW